MRSRTSIRGERGFRPFGLSGNFQLLHQNLRVPAATLVFLASVRRKIIRCTLGKSALGLEVSKSLRRQCYQLRQADFASSIFSELNQFSANALILVRWIDIKTG